MNLDTPEGRYAATQALAHKGYNAAMAEHPMTSPGTTAPTSEEVVAWRIKDYADGWWATTLPEIAHGNLNGALVQPLVLKSSYDAMRAERDEALDRVDELEGYQETISADFEKDCWVAMRSLLNECHYDWRDAEIDGIQADEAREYISTTISEVEASEKRWKARAQALEAELLAAREALSAEDAAKHLTDIAQALWDRVEDRRRKSNEEVTSGEQDDATLAYGFDKAAESIRNLINARALSGNRSGK